jgi:deoxyribodipyrimidine photo-lyase
MSGSKGLFESPEFEASTAAAHARIAAIRPHAYARTRNHLDGDVTRLSPYLTHGYTTLHEALAGVLRLGDLPITHKLVFEFAWREHFHHVWQHRGEAIFDSLHEGVLPDAAYSRVWPDDIRQARTGVPVIDQAVRTLYATGYLHNHARMWLASYAVHIRKLHWRSGADWLYGHLLDGDLASNHLSWQWVAGTGSSKPYLFNADNVARYAPAAWHSPGSVIDTDYAALDRMARDANFRPRPAADPVGQMGVEEPPLLAAPGNFAFTTPQDTDLTGRDVWLVQPWALGPALNAKAPEGALRVGCLLPEWHAQWRWNAVRWDFVMRGLASACDVLWWAPVEAGRTALAAAASVQGWQDLHTATALQDLPLQPRPSLLPSPHSACASFSRHWQRSVKGLQSAAELLV